MDSEKTRLSCLLFSCSNMVRVTSYVTTSIDSDSHNLSCHRKMEKIKIAPSGVVTQLINRADDMR